MLVHTSSITPRLQYIFRFIGKEIIGEDFQLTNNADEFRSHSGPKINYTGTPLADNEFYLSPHSLLFENDIHPQSISCFETDGVKCFFKTNGDFVFDIFAASFYLLSRYEEYLPFAPDAYGRYDHKNSLAYKEGFLNQPLINNWLRVFKRALLKKFPLLVFHISPFTFIPTYDIDMAWSYRHKGTWRNFAGLVRLLVQGKMKEWKQRMNVLLQKQKDPFDAYGWLNQLHDQYKLKPYYFFLVAKQKGRYDKNISPVNPAMKNLIYDHVIRYPVGVHPSWHSGDDPSLLKQEIDTLKKITGTSIQSSRQHYIRVTLPETFRQLLDNNIRFDFSMGYGSINGFRASVASVFYWYDLEKEMQTDLLLFPFCFMDANSFYEQKYTPAEALEELRHYCNAVHDIDGTFIMIWHNSFLGTDELFTGWRDVYEKFIREVSTVFLIS